MEDIQFNKKKNKLIFNELVWIFHDEISGLADYSKK